MTIRIRVATAAAALALGLSLTACGSGDDALIPGVGEGTALSAGRPGVEGARHNRADVEFTQGMIAHHQGALAMAEMATDAARSAEVRALAGRISRAQQPEIELMSSWLRAWGEETTADKGGHGEGGHGEGGHGERELEGLSGAEFDRAFLEEMIVHHRDAVHMSQAVAADGSAPQVLALAQKIAADQTAEIAEMEQLLRER